MPAKKSPFTPIPGVGLEVTNGDGEKVMVPIRMKFRDLRRTMKSMESIGDSSDIESIFEALPRHVADAIDEIDAEHAVEAIAKWAEMLTGGVGEAPAS